MDEACTIGGDAFCAARGSAGGGGGSGSNGSVHVTLVAVCVCRLLTCYNSVHSSTPGQETEERWDRFTAAASQQWRLTAVGV